MMANSILFWIFFGSVIMTGTYGLELEFSATPANMSYPLTEHLKLRCSLSVQEQEIHFNTTAPSELTGDRRHIPAHDVEEEEIRLVTSIIVTKGESNAYVASVTQFSSAQAFIDKDRVTHVTGSLSTHTGRRPYLELTWKYPDLHQAGGYTCEINAVEENGHSVVVSKKLRVKNRPPTMDNMADFVHTNRRRMEERYESLLAKVESLKAEGSTCCTSLQRQVDALKGNAVAMQNQSDVMAVSIKENEPHSERGSGTCGYSATWTLDITNKDRRRSKIIQGKFARPYDQVPKMLVTPSYVNVRKGDQVIFGVRVLKVTTTGYTIECYFYFDIVVWDMHYEWISTK